MCDFILTASPFTICSQSVTNRASTPIPNCSATESRTAFCELGRLQSGGVALLGLGRRSARKPSWRTIQRSKIFLCCIVAQPFCQEKPGWVRQLRKVALFLVQVTPLGRLDSGLPRTARIPALSRLKAGLQTSGRPDLSAVAAG